MSNWFFVSLAFVIDQISKTVFLSYIGKESQLYLAKKKIRLSYVINRGAFLGFMKENKKILYLLNALGILMLALLMTFYQGTFVKAGLALMLGGAIGNNIDRIRYKGVVDFIAFSPNYSIHYNVADFFIFAGAIIASVGYLLKQ